MTTTQTVRRVAVIGGARLPFCRSNTKYSTSSNLDMLTATLKGLVQRYNLQGKALGEVAGGAVLKHSKDFNMVREAVLSSGLAPETPAYDVQQACGTGLEAAILVANKIALGQIESGIACGVDTTSDAPITVSEGLRKILLEANRGKTNGDRIKALLKIRPKHFTPGIPNVNEPRTHMSMGQHCEVMVKEWGITREAQDELAYLSHKNGAAAYEAGFLNDMLVPFAGVTRDNNLRGDTTFQKLSTLKPAFDRSPAGTITAGNATPLTDGASSVLLASEAWAKANNLPILAYLTFSHVAAVDFVGKKEGLLMAPAYAVPPMLARAGLTLQDFDFYEIHEAFAGQVLCTLKAWEDKNFCQNRLGLDAPLGSIDRSKLNIKGSSLAFGHPFAATGARIVHTLAKLLDEKGSGRGLISICAAGGQGVVAIMER